MPSAVSVEFIRVGACVMFFFSSRRRHTRLQGDWSSDVCSSDLPCNLPLHFGGILGQKCQAVQTGPNAEAIEVLLLRFLDRLPGVLEPIDVDVHARQVPIAIYRGFQPL